MADRVSFDFCDLEDIRPGLDKCAIGTHGARIIKTHLGTLQKLGSTLNATELARENAERLATGYEDFVVVLLEPSDKAEDAPYDEMFSQSTALQRVDESLRLAFKGQRCVENTIILDVRPYRSDRIRKRQKVEQGEDGCLLEDDRAYRGFGDLISKLSPKAFIICQCQPCGEQQDLTLNFSSSTKASGRIKAFTQYDKISVIVKSFHPMWFEYTDRNDDPLRRVMREYLFDSTFIVAANVLVGRRLSGFGLTNLRHCALDGAAFRFEPEGVRVTYHWVDENDVASDELIQRLKALEMTSKVTRYVFKTNQRRMLTKARTKAKKILRCSLTSIGKNTIEAESLRTLRTACHI